jgi:hypothetical protein
MLIDGVFVCYYLPNLKIELFIMSKVKNLTKEEILTSYTEAVDFLEK